MDSSPELNRLAALATYDILDSFSQKEYDEITFLASTICNVPVALITFIDKDRQVFFSKVGTDVAETPREYSFCAHAINDLTRPMTVSDLRLDDRFSNNPLVAQDPNVVFYAGAPLVSKDGFGLGTVCVIDLKPRELTTTQLESLQILANQVMKLLETRREGIEEKKKIEAEFGVAIELASLATWQIDFKENTVHHSGRLQEWLGIDSVTTDYNGSFEGIYPEDKDMVARAIDKALQPATGGFFDAEYSILHRTSGNRRIIHSRGQTTFDRHGNPQSIAGTALDVTGLREIELALQIQVHERTTELESTNEEIRMVNEELHSTIEQLEHTNQRLEKSNDQLAQYAYVASHDLQEPLRKIRVFSSMLSEGKMVSAEQNILIEKVSDTAGRMTTLIDNLLSLSRTVYKDENLVTVNLSGVMKDVLEEYDSVIREKNARIVVGPLPEIKGISEQIHQLLSNLLGNALKFTDRLRTPEIIIKAYPVEEDEKQKYLTHPLPDTEYTQIKFCDNGIGFPDHQEERIFEVFKRLNDRSAYSGSGIGLALCRRIVENHHGYIFGRGFPGKGSEFHLILPVVS